MTAPAIEGFIAVVEDILEEDGKVMPVVLVNPETDVVNVSYRRTGGNLITSLGHRAREVELEWTVTGPVWQDANDVNEQIIATMLERKAVPVSDAGIAAPEDDVFIDEGKGPVFSITTSATLRDVNWGS